MIDPCTIRFEIGFKLRVTWLFDSIIDRKKKPQPIIESLLKREFFQWNAIVVCEPEMYSLPIFVIRIEMAAVLIERKMKCLMVEQLLCIFM